MVRHETHCKNNATQFTSCQDEGTHVGGAHKNDKEPNICKDLGFLLLWHKWCM